MLFAALMLLMSGAGMLLISAFVMLVLKVPAAEVAQFFTGAADARTITIIQWLNNASQIIMFVLPVYVLIKLAGRWSVSGLMWRNPGWQIIIVPFWLISSSALIDLAAQFNEALIPAGSWLEALLRPLEEQGNDLVNQMLMQGQGWSFIMVLFTIGVVPALCEELAFRGAMQPLLAKATGNIHVAVWLTAAVFSAIHLQFYTFLPRLLLGAMLGYLVVWTGSLMTSMFAHLVNNVMALLMHRMYSAPLEGEAEASAGEMWFSYALSIFTFVVLTRLLMRYSQWPFFAREYLQPWPTAAPPASAAEWPEAEVKD